MVSDNFKVKHNMVDTNYGRHAVPNKYGMSVLRDVFPHAKVTKEAIVLFSTGGVTGHTTTLEQLVKDYPFPSNEVRTISFVILKPEHVVTMYGNAVVSGMDDLQFLMTLRSNSLHVMSEFGKGE
jgi:hypothetical protein